MNRQRDVFLICALQAGPTGAYFTGWRDAGHVTQPVWSTKPDAASQFESYDQARVEAELISAHYTEWLRRNDMLPLQVLAFVNQVRAGLTNQRPN